MKTGIKLISEERKEQIKKHGFTSSKDARYLEGELLDAAMYTLTLSPEYYPEHWDNWFQDKLNAKEIRMSSKQFKIERLKIAGALIAAQIDKLNYE